MRVGERLDLPHHRRRLLAPLELDVRRHVAPGAVLGLQRAVVLLDDQLDELRHERLVALDVGGVAERGREVEVEVAGRGVPGDAGQEPVLAEQSHQVLRALGDARRRHAHVLDDQRRARQPQPPGEAEQPLADHPGELDRLGLARERAGAEHVAPGQQLLGGGNLRLELAIGVGPVLDQQGCRLGRQLLPVLGRTGPGPGGSDQCRGHHQLARARACCDEARHRVRGSVDRREVEPGDRGLARQRARLEHDLGDEGEGALRADHEAAEDLERGLGVEERAQPVAGGVLDLELAPHALGELGVGEQLGADVEQALGELGLGRGELLLGVGRRRVDDRAAGEHERHRAHGRVAVPRDPAAHAAAVVVDDAADAGGVGRRRVRAEAEPVRREHAVGEPEHGPRLHARPLAVLLHLHAVEVAAHVDEDSVGLALAVEARPAGAEREVLVVLAAVGEQLLHVFHPARHRHDLGEVAVRARVGRVTDEVVRPAEDAVGAEEPLQIGDQPAVRPGGEAVGRAVVVRGAAGAADPRGLRRQDHDAENRAVQGRRERRVLCTRATEDAGMRRSAGVMRCSCPGRRLPPRGSGRPSRRLSRTRHAVRRPP